MVVISDFLKYMAAFQPNKLDFVLFSPPKKKTLFFQIPAYVSLDYRI